MYFADVHSHLLYDVDDGISSYDDMIAAVDMAYADGVRLLCATPHCCPDWFGNNREKINKAFSQLEEYCRDKYPDLKLFLGNELFYANDGAVWLKNGLCTTMGATKYVLVEFGVDEPERLIEKSIHELFNQGYVPIIAHVERYSKLSFAKIEEFHRNGVLIQVNVSNMRGFAFFETIRLKKLLASRVVDLVSTDTHDLQYRPPLMSKFYEYVSGKYGIEYANKIFHTNAKAIFEGIAEE